MHPDISVIFKPSLWETVVHAIAERILGHPLPEPCVGSMLGIGRFWTTESVGSKTCQNDPVGHANQGPQHR